MVKKCASCFFRILINLFLVLDGYYQSLTLDKGEGGSCTHAVQLTPIIIVTGDSDR